MSVKYEGQLVSLYLKWKDSPELYQEEMAETVDKVIFSTLRLQPYEPIYRRIEDSEDLIQDLRLLCFKLLSKIKYDDNKKIFNYLRVSIKFHLLDKVKRVGRNLDKEVAENQVFRETSYNSPELLFFDNEMLRNIAREMILGETKESICKTLGITRATLVKNISKLKEIYEKRNI